MIALAKGGAIMPNQSARIVVLTVLAVLYWLAISHSTQAKEPWDAASYWTAAYPGSLLLSGAAGVAFPKRGWLAGVIVTFAQLPVLWIGNGIGSMWVFGIILLAILALPAAAVASLASRFAARAQ